MVAKISNCSNSLIDLSFLLISIILAVASPVLGQDDVTTRSGASAYGGAFITGPASNPLSFLNGDVYRTFASGSPYLIPDFAPAVLLNDQFPKWIGLGVEERFGFESYHSGSFKLNDDDSHFLNRFRLHLLDYSRQVRRPDSARIDHQLTDDFRLLH